MNRPHYGFDGGMLPGAVVAGDGLDGANVLGPGDAVPGVGARLGAGDNVGAGVAPGIGDSDGTPLGPVIMGAAVPSEP